MACFHKSTNLKVLLFLIIVICCLPYNNNVIRTVNACGLPSSGGGGGCGGGGSYGGGGGCGCGRKKRDNIANDGDLVSTQNAIQTAMFADFESAKFFVTCNQRVTLNRTEPNVKEEKSEFKFVSNGESYCSAGNNKVWCTVAALMA